MQRLFPFSGTFPKRGSRLVFALALSAALFTAGCAEISLPELSQPEPVAPVIQPTQDLAVDAAAAFASRNMPQAELLYSRLLEREDLDKAERISAWGRLAQSAFLSRHYYQAKQALDKQVSLDNSILGAWPWHELFIKTLGALDRPDLIDSHQAWLAAHTELPFSVRSQAAIAFSEIYARNGDFVRAVNVLARMHKTAPDKAAKATMETLYTQRLRDLSETQLMGMARLISGGGANSFPHALILREAKRRGQATHSALPERPALAPAQTALAQAALAGPLLAQTVRIRSDQPADLQPTKVPAGMVRMALALPLSGRFASTGWKVLRGAGAAQARLAAQGKQIELKAINTEATDWREQLAALPPDFHVIGGPLQVDTFKAMEAAGITSQRAVFGFVPDLGNQQEGKTAWRFFPSPRDQVRALIDLTADKVGIRSVAVLAPRNRFGQRMAEIFQAEAKAKGLRIAASGTYPPDDHPRWKQSVAQLLHVPEGFRGNKSAPLPMPDFGAVFVPEDWTQSELLVSNFHFYEGEHLLFLGTELWSVALDNLKEVDDTYFQQAVCPGAWWPETKEAKALQAKLNETPNSSNGQNITLADFWVGLGHDFVQMAARLQFAGDLSPSQLNERLAGLKAVPYSLAPIAWDAEGRATQSLYLFSPRKDGKNLVDPEALRQSVAKAKERREKRLSTARDIRKAKETKQ
jgi:hypothetical protein